MRKLIVMSLVVAIFWIPLFIARTKEPLPEAVRHAQKRFAIFCAVYVLLILYVVPRL